MASSTFIKKSKSIINYFVIIRKFFFDSTITCYLFFFKKNQLIWSKFNGLKAIIRDLNAKNIFYSITDKNKYNFKI